MARDRALAVAEQQHARIVGHPCEGLVDRHQLRGVVASVVAARMPLYCYYTTVICMIEKRTGALARQILSAFHWSVHGPVDL